MVLSTHAVVGGALGALLPSRPALAFILGFASHFVLDAVPHWDYPIRSPSLNPSIGAPVHLDRPLLLDTLTIGTDAFVGVLAVLVLLRSPVNGRAILFGALGAVVPDSLQVLYAQFPYEPLSSLQRFHRRVHARHIAPFPFGIGSQLFLAVLAIWLAKWYAARNVVENH